MNQLLFKMGPISEITTLIVILVIFLVFLLITRELWCWFLKLNKIVEFQQKQIELQRTQIDLLSLMALKNGVPDKKILESLNRPYNGKLISREWIESKQKDISE